MFWHHLAACPVRVVMFLGLVCLTTRLAEAQLQITEVMSDSLSSEPQWEWIEVRNAGPVAIDLNGWVFDDDDGAIVGGPNINNFDGPTIIPAGGTAVLYNGTSFGFNPQLYRDAWQIGAGVPMIGVSTAPGLNNGGDQIGLWSSYTNYFNDVVDNGMGMLVVGSFNSAASNVDYATFPGGPAGVTSYWNGQGDYRDGLNWLVSTPGIDNAVTSVEVTTQAPINSTADVGNPGVVPGGPRAAGLLVSEIMYDPRSPEPGWEWIEVINNTGSTIDFAATNYFLDDAAGAAIGEANITAGSIPQGGVAILFDDRIDPADFATAWGAGLNAIPVSAWPALNNSNDTIGIWNDATSYNNDKANMTFSGTVANVPYDSDGVVWPANDGNGSIYLTNLTADPSDGTNWLLSFVDGTSFNASPVFGTVVQHNGGDVGSPGSGPGGTPVIDADFNDDLVLDGQDIDLLTMDIAAGTNNVAMFDLNGDGAVTYDDVIHWLADAGEANLPSMASYLQGDANLDGSVNGQDFVVWNDHKFAPSGRWTEGDFDANGNVNGQDFVRWNNNKFTSADGVAAVPEPSGWIIWLTAVATLALRHKQE